MEGKLSEYENTLGLVKSIDLSCNMLNGEIPREITELVGLISLNLSRNNLSGQIPSEIGHLHSLDALDLSNNHFSGHIPPSLTQIDRLSVLNLSNNKFSGKIPTSTQLQSFDVTAYMGNPGLCGDPLPKKCPGDQELILSKPVEPVGDQEEEEEFIAQFVMSMAVGFGAAFWGVCGALFLNKTWRYAYFKFLDDLKDWIYVKAMLYKAKLLRRTTS